MKLGIFTTCTLPYERGDTIDEALTCYKELADEVFVNDRRWPHEFSWEHIGQTFHEAYERTNSDAVLHMDLDFIFHEKDYEDIRKAAWQMLDNNLPAMSFYKYQFILPDRYNLKSRLVIMVNKRDYGNRIRFDSGGDLAQPSLDGKYLSPDSVPQAKIGFWNYEKILKTKEQIMDDVGRMERAYKRHFGRTQYGSDGTDEDAYSKWYEAQKGKMNKPQEKVRLEDHPKCMQETIKNLKPENFGYSGFGLIEEGVYA